MSLWTVRSEWPFYWYFHRLFSVIDISWHEKPRCHKNNFQYLGCIKIFHLIINRFHRHFLLRKCYHEYRLQQHFCFSALYILRWYKSHNLCQYHNSMNCLLVTNWKSIVKYWGFSVHFLILMYDLIKSQFPVTIKNFYPHFLRSIEQILLKKSYLSVCLSVCLSLSL